MTSLSPLLVSSQPACPLANATLERVSGCGALPTIVVKDGDSVALRFESFEWKLPFVEDDGVFAPERSVSMWGKGFSGHVPGPVLIVEKGASFQVNLTNGLEPFEPGTHAVNIHTHGLHVSSSEDDMAVVLEPGEFHLYNYTIPLDHAGGTHWYHPHMHPLSELFVSSGAAGMLIVEDAPDALEIPEEIRLLPEQSIIIQHVDLPRLFDLADGISGDPLSPRQNLKDTTFRLDLSGAGYDITNFQEGLSAFKQGGLYMINGLWRPRLQVEIGKWYRWRILHVATAVDVKLALYDRQESNPANCTIRVIAKDGVYLRNGPRDLDFSALHSIHLHPASRADVLIRCNGAPGSVAQIYDNFNGFTGGFVDPNKIDPVERRELLFNLDLINSSSEQHTPISNEEFSFQPCLPIYLEDLQQAQVERFGGLNISASPPLLVRPNFFNRWTSDNKTFQITITGFSLNDFEFGGWDPASALPEEQRNISIIPAGHVQQWELTLLSRSHPLHIHVNHFQLMDDFPDETGFTKAGDWVDTVRPRQDFPVVFRFRPSTFLGRVPLHCHNHDHSDEGAMAQAWIINDPQANLDVRRPWADACSSVVALQTPSVPTTMPTTTVLPSLPLQIGIKEVANTLYSHEGIVLSAEVVRAESGLPIDFCWTRKAGSFLPSIESSIGSVINSYESCTDSFSSLYATARNGPYLVIRPYSVPETTVFRYELRAQQGFLSPPITVGDFVFRVYGFPNPPVLQVSASQGIAAISQFTLTALPPDESAAFQYRFAVERNTAGTEPMAFSTWSNSPTLENVTLPFTQRTLDVSFISVVAFVRDGFGAESRPSNPAFIRLQSPTHFANTPDNLSQDPENILRNQLSYASVVTRATNFSLRGTLNLLKSEIVSEIERAVSIAEGEPFNQQMSELAMFAMRELTLSLEDGDVEVTERAADLFRKLMSIWLDRIHDIIEDAEALGVVPNLAFAVPAGVMGVATEILSQLSLQPGLCSYDFSIVDLHRVIISTAFASRLPGQEGFKVKLERLQSIARKEFSSEIAGRYRPPGGDSFVDILDAFFDSGPAPVYDPVVVAVFRSGPDSFCVNEIFIDSGSRRHSSIVQLQQKVVTDVVHLEIVSPINVPVSRRNVTVGLQIFYEFQEDMIACGIFDSQLNQWLSDKCKFTIASSSMIHCECSEISYQTDFAAWTLLEVHPDGRKDATALTMIITACLFMIWMLLSIPVDNLDRKQSELLRKGASLVLVFSENHSSKRIDEEKPNVFLKREAFEKLRKNRKPMPQRKMSSLASFVFNQHSVFGTIFHHDSATSRLKRSVASPLSIFGGTGAVFFSSSSPSLSSIKTIFAGVITGLVAILVGYILQRLSVIERRDFADVANLHKHALEVSRGHNLSNFKDEYELMLRQLQVYLRKKELIAVAPQRDQRESSIWFLRWFFDNESRLTNRIYGGLTDLSAGMRRKNRALSYLQELHHIKTKGFTRESAFVGFVLACLAAFEIYVITLSSPSDMLLVDCAMACTFGIAVAEPLLLLFIGLTGCSRPSNPRPLSKNSQKMVCPRERFYSWDSQISTTSVAPKKKSRRRQHSIFSVVSGRHSQPAERTRRQSQFSTLSHKLKSMIMKDADPES